MVDGWVIRTEDLGKRYGGSAVDAVESLSITVEPGTIQGILGPNGAGKTTTLSMLCGLIEPTSGRIRFAERFGAKDIRRFIGYVPQDLALYPSLTGRENLAFFGGLYGVPRRKLNKRISDLLDLVGLAERADDLARRYSTGMMRRLNLAAGLLHDPEVLLLDEPTVGVDPQSRNRIFEFIDELRRQGATILYTTHYMEEASRLCDDVAIMDRGRILLSGDPAGLVRDHGRFRMELGVDPRTGDLADAIGEIDGVESAGGDAGTLTVQLGGGADTLTIIDRVKAIAAARNVRLTLVNIVEPTLETIFLDITGRELRDGAGAP